MWGGVAKPGSPTARLIAPGTRGVRSNMRRMGETGTARARALTRSVVLPISASSLRTVGSGAGDDGDLDEVVRGRQARLDGGARGRVRLVDLPQDLRGLALGVQLRVVRDRAGDVDGVAELGGGGDAGPDLVASDAH